MLSCAALSRRGLTLMSPCASLSGCSLMLMLCRTNPGGRSPVLVLSRPTLGRNGPVLMLSCATLGGLSLMIVLSALRRRSLMLMGGFGSFFGQVRRDGLDAKGLDSWHYDWRRGSRKGTGGVFAADHHSVIPCQQGADTQ